MRKTITLFFLVLSFFAVAQAPANYYNTAVGKTEAALKTQLSAIVLAHTELTYTGLWTAFQTTDKRADGKVWDMYSNCSFIFGTDQDSGSGGTSECQKYNREHSFPKSWFKDATPMYTDLFHLYPTDKYVNNQRGNYGFGETSSPTNTFANGSKIGSCTYSGYSGYVFEPADEYKGDFARTYFYMVTAYENVVDTWSTNNTTASPHLDSTKYPALNSWSVSLFLKWNAQDPVSTKEINRNNAVYGIQGNRNPFIDHPELAEYIWGSKKGQAWSLTSAIDEVKINFSISPNPVKDELTVSTDETDLNYTIFSASGQLLKSEKLVSSKTISVQSFKPGLYLIQLQSGSRKSIQKFIITQ